MNYIVLACLVGLIFSWLVIGLFFIGAFRKPTPPMPRPPEPPRTTTIGGKWQEFKPITDEEVERRR